MYLLEERKKHILEYHLEAKDLLDLLPDVLGHPDFTQRNRKPYTVRFYKFYPNLLVGERTIQNKYLTCPVRLNVDLPEGYKNSVITLYLLSAYPKKVILNPSLRSRTGFVKDLFVLTIEILRIRSE